MRAVMWVLGAVLVGIAGWSSWWLIGAQGQEAGIEAWLEKQRARGWQAEAMAVSVTGYPDTFDLRITDLALADPETGWAWSAPNWNALSTPWAPSRFNVTWPSSQSLSVPGDRAEIITEHMSAILDVTPDTAMELQQFTADIRALAISGQSGWRAAADKIAFDLSERPPDLAPPNSYTLVLEGQKLTLPEVLVAKLDPTGLLKTSVDAVKLAGHAAFDDPLGRIALEDGKLALRAATIREAGFRWGEMRLDVGGSIEVDDAGHPVGKLSIEAREWRQMVRVAESAGVLDRQTAATVIDAVDLLTALTGSGDTLSITLGLRGGEVLIGPFAIADAPRLAPPR